MDAEPVRARAVEALSSALRRIGGPANVVGGADLLDYLHANPDAKAALVAYLAGTPAALAADHTITIPVANVEAWCRTVLGEAPTGPRVEGLDLDELHAAIATADWYDPDWLDKARQKRAARLAGGLDR